MSILVKLTLSRRFLPSSGGTYNYVGECDAMGAPCAICEPVVELSAARQVAYAQGVRGTERSFDH